MSNSSREAMLAAVKINGDALMTCTNVKLRNDKEIVMEAVKTGRDALLWASDNMRKDVDVLFEAVTYNGRALRYAIGLRDHKKIVLQAVKQDHPPMWILVITPLLVTIAIPVAYYLFVENERILKNFISNNTKLYNFLANKWYFDELYNFIFVEPIKKIGLFFWKKGDINSIDRYGPDGLSKLVKNLSDKAVNFQSGYLYHYAFVMLIGFSILLTYLILY